LLGFENSDVVDSLGNLAVLYRLQGRFTDAEPLFKRSVAILEKRLSPEHPALAGPLNNLAQLYFGEGRYPEAEALYKRAIAIVGNTLGPMDPHLGVSLDNLALTYIKEGRFEEAAPLYKRILMIVQNAFGSDHPNMLTALTNLGGFYDEQGQYSDAEPLHRRALSIAEKIYGPEHPVVGTMLNNLSTVYSAQGRISDAESLYQRSLTVYEHALGPDHPDVANTLTNLAALAYGQGDWSRAVEYWRRSTGILMRRAQRSTADVGHPLVGKGRREPVQKTVLSRALVKAAHRLATLDRGAEPRLLLEMFETAQWALASEAAASLAQMAARGAKGDPALAVLVRERQDLVGQWQGRDAARTKAVSQPPEEREKDAEAANNARLEGIDQRISEIDTTLKVKFPDYAALASPAPLPVADVQTLLGSDEALVLFLDTPEWKPTPEETFVWVVTKSDLRWARSDLGTPSLQREVAALRCGLDYDGTWGTAGSRCPELLKTNYTEIDHRNEKPLPFDTERAFALYKALFGQVEDIIKGKQLLIVPSGALTQLPFQVLVTNNPQLTPSGPEDFRRAAAWLVRSHALTVLPSVSSLKALRQLAKDSHASRMLIGFGNPLLDGPNASYAKWAGEARLKQSCPKTPTQRIAGVTGERRGVPLLRLRGNVIDVADVLSQVPLPETADELCAVARDLGVSGEEIRLGERATEAEVKRLSATGELANYRTIHFATHGALAGQIGNGSEPGLLLTPPQSANETDDGYLSASEIAALKLDADWVILSACNTAAGGADNAEALSGLARAFFYAGARSLLVSHWAVDSVSTVKLITKALSIMSADKSVGRAEAMRHSMLAMIESGDPKEAHPAYWAPFVVVGEGSSTTLAPLTTSSTVPESGLNAPTKPHVHPKKKPTVTDWRKEIWH
jgi:CHAT domain-containing protein/tetratricopeptide (TPR) repeat protein